MPYSDSAGRETIKTDSSAANSACAIRVHDLSIIAKGGKPLLMDVSFSIPRGSFITVVGLSGCGKSTLIRALAGILEPGEGRVTFSGHSISEIKAQYPLAVGYIPQFGSFHGELTIREILSCAAALRLPPSVSQKIRDNWLAHITVLAGIEKLLEQKFSTLSGGQMRRIALAEELVGDPAFLLLDELTTGLDVYSDGEIMAWLRELAHQHAKTIVLVTHGTQHLNMADGIIFLHAGKLIHFGNCESLLDSQKVASLEELYGRFSSGNGAITSPPDPETISEPIPEPLQTDHPPTGWRQIPALVSRQAKLLIRDKGQLIIQAALIVTFPLLVAVFALNGLPEVRSLVAESSESIVRSLEQRLYYLKNAVEASSLISGLVMFQVILLTLIGANNGAREIARERDILRKELFAGLSPPACITSKFLQISILSFLQAFWMAWFVKIVCGFPGEFFFQFLILFATTLAMSTTCLAISAASPSPERASLLSIYLVGFQLPLSGAALALPGWLAEACRPFIAAYWGWSGYLHTLKSTRYFRLVSDSTKTQIADFDVSLTVLSLHIVLSLALASFFLRRLPRNS